MEMKRMTGWVLVAALLGSLVFYVQPLYAKDELHLTGKVTSIDLKTNTVMIDVQTVGCRGLRTFAVRDAADMEDFIGKKIDFFIDSAVCDAGAVYAILPQWRVKK
jgi:hypothetical protein